MKAVFFRTFLLRPQFLGHFYSPASAAAHDKLRFEVTQFINGEVGKGDLVSISENRLGETGLTITVWYRAESDA